MGSEALLNFSVNGKPKKGKARLETDVLQLRGTKVRMSIPFKAMRNARSSDGVLRFETSHGGPERSALLVELSGAAARKWADKILHPPCNFLWCDLSLAARSAERVEEVSEAQRRAVGCAAQGPRRDQRSRRDDRRAGGRIGGRKGRQFFGHSHCRKIRYPYQGSIRGDPIRWIPGRFK